MNSSYHHLQAEFRLKPDTARLKIQARSASELFPSRQNHSLALRACITCNLLSKCWAKALEPLLQTDQLRLEGPLAKLTLARRSITVDGQLILVEDWANFVDEVMDVSELTIDAGKPNVSDVVQLNQLLHYHFAD